MRFNYICADLSFIGNKALNLFCCFVKFVGMKKEMMC